MSHLLAIAVGPVQEFIAAARRTRDLWFGSYLLSEISRAVAKSVEADGGKLIFPASSDAENVANVILAELPSGEPRDVAAKAKHAAHKRWLEFAGEAHREASGVIRQDIWDDQVKDVIEFYAAWIASSADYGADRGKLMRLLAGRKSCRDCLPAKGRAGVPKSSLDGQRESLLKDPARERWPERFRARLRIREGEQLDVVGLVKRVAGGTQPYPSVSRVAADPWVRGNSSTPAFAELMTACQEFPARVLHRLDPQAFPQFQSFPYEGTAVYVSRHHEWEEEIDEEDRLSIGDMQDALERLPEPNPYLAVLVADGDKMGEAISHLPDSEPNRTFSQALTGFADEARKIVNNHNGVLVYAGGDDVLAFLPVDKCLCSARALREKFIELLDKALDTIFKQVPAKKPETPTLSVGVAIGHFMENLEDLLDYGRAAEKAAKKPDRDGLAIHLHKRGGAPIGVRARWAGGTDNMVVLLEGTQQQSKFNLRHFDERLLCFAHLLLAEAIPSKLPYELRKLAEHYAKWKQDTADQQHAVKAAMQQDVIRVIRDKQPRSGRAYMPEIEKIVRAIGQPKGLTEFTEQLLVARQIATALRQAAGRSVATEEVTS